MTDSRNEMFSNEWLETQALDVARAMKQAPEGSLAKSLHREDLFILAAIPILERTLEQRKQTRKASLAESLMNVAIGYGMAIVTQIIVYPWFGINVPISSNVAIALIFTAVALARQFAVRRLFEKLRVGRVLP